MGKSADSNGSAIQSDSMFPKSDRLTAWSRKESHLLPSQVKKGTDIPISESR